MIYLKIKQSFRNRCVIASPNGPLNLVIPVIRNTKNKIKDVQIDHSQQWIKIHWKSLESAYRSSPYFEYYEDDFLDQFIFRIIVNIYLILIN